MKHVLSYVNFLTNKWLAAVKFPLVQRKAFSADGQSAHLQFHIFQVNRVTQHISKIVFALLACMVPAMAVTYQKGIDIIGGHQPTANESSGVCRASTTGNYWTLGDSGGKNQIYRFDKTGKVVQTVTINGVSNRDWEDIASVTVNNKFYIIIGEIGNNTTNTPIHSLIIINNPAPTATSQSVAGIVNFMWSDRKQHECESMAVDNKGNAFVLSQENKSSACLETFAIFDSAGRPRHISPSSPIVATKVTSTKPKLNYTTGLDISSDGLRMVYSNILDSVAYEVTRSKVSDVWNFDRSTSVNLGGVALMRQGICYDFDQRSIVSTSEQTAWFVPSFKYKYAQVFFVKRN